MWDLKFLLSDSMIILASQYFCWDVNLSFSSRYVRNVDIASFHFSVWRYTDFVLLAEQWVAWCLSEHHANPIYEHCSHSSLLKTNSARNHSINWVRSAQSSSVCALKSIKKLIFFKETVTLQLWKQSEQNRRSFSIPLSHQWLSAPLPPS